MDKVAAWWEGYDSLLRKPPAHSWCSPLILAGAYGVCLTHGNTSLCESSLPSKTLRAGVLRCGTLQNSTKNRFCQCFFAPYISSRSIINSFISPTINTRHLIGVSMRRELPRPSQHRATPPEVRESACHSQHITTHRKKTAISLPAHMKTALFTLFLRRYENAVEFFGRGAGAHSPSLQQSLQWPALPRLVLAGQAGATARRVHSTRLSLAEGARHAAAAAGLPHPLRAVLRQWLAQQERPGVARLAADHRPHRAGEPDERSQRRGETKHTETGHSAD